MRSTVVALGLALAIGGIAYGSSRVTRSTAAAPVASIEPAALEVATTTLAPASPTKVAPPLPLLRRLTAP
jgi:hypothetical protein